MRKHTLNVLVIEHNPLLSDGSRASDLVAMTEQVHPAVEELLDDIRYASHGQVEGRIAAWETVDEFPRHKCLFRLPSGESHTLDEATLRKLFENGWYGWWSKEWFTKEVCPGDAGFSYDYGDLMEKHDLVKRRAAGEFNLVLLVNLDPVYTFEACMIGRGSYWINGDPIEADCPLTAVMNVSVSRRDANFECFGHMMEMIMSHTFTGGSDCVGYREGEWKGQSPEDMNLWQRFVLAGRNYDGISGCGNVHFSPNSVSDYDWKNETPVESSWRDWLEHYPALTGEHEPTTCRAYLPLGIGEKDACRLHHRWWFLCMPHAEGRTADGYSHSWWDYFVSLDYVVSLEPAGKGAFTLIYRSGRREEVRADSEAVVCEDRGSTLTVWRDGKSCTAQK